MTKRSGSETRKRTVIVGVRLTPSEYGKLKRAAKKRGMTINSFMRESAARTAAWLNR